MKKANYIIALVLCFVLTAGVITPINTYGEQLSEPPAIETMAGFTTTPMVSAGASHTVALKSDGTLWGWGNDVSGQLGIYIITSRNPSLIMENVIAVSAGVSYTMAIRNDNSLWAWGFNSAGQLGDGTTRQRALPIHIMDDVIAVSAGNGHTMAIKSDNSLWAWGNNPQGQIGDGTTTARHTPVRIMDDVIAVSAGIWHTMAIKSDNSLWAWGRNGGHQLGDGTRDDSHSPILIMDNVIAVSAGANHTLAIKSDNSLWAWGTNNGGQIGDGTNITRESPVHITDSVIAVSAGNRQTMAIKSDNSLWAWGFNDYGQVGDGTRINRESPVRIMNDVIDASIGMVVNNHAVAIKSDGNLLAWGVNDRYQLGDGTQIDRNSPVQVLGENGIGFFNVFDSSDIPAPCDITAFIRQNGTHIYSPVIGGETYAVYDMRSRRVVENANGFSLAAYQNAVGAFYLIGFNSGESIDSSPTAGYLVRDRGILRQAGYLHFGVNNGNVAERISQLDQRYLNAVWLEILYDSNAEQHLDIESIFEEFGNNIFYLSLFFTLVNFNPAEIIENIATAIDVAEGFLVDEPVPTWAGLHMAKKNNFEKLENHMNSFRPRLNTVERYIECYQTALDMETAFVLADIHEAVYELASKYISHEIDKRTNLSLAGRTLRTVMSAFVPGASVLFRAWDVADSEIHLRRDINVNGNRVSINTRFNTDDDLINLPRRISGFVDNRNHLIINPAWSNGWLNNDFVCSNITHCQIVVVKCPVDVSVFNRDGELIGKAENHIQTFLSDSALTISSQGGATVLTFPHANDYRIEISATNDGLMNFSQFRTNDAGEIISQTSVRSMPIENGNVFSVNSNDEIDYSRLFSDGEALTVLINTEVQGKGEVVSNGNGFVRGGEVVLTAFPNRFNVFLGWYENGVKLEHAEKTYAFNAESERNLEARFIMLGDVNHDNRVTSASATLLAKWLAGYDVQICETAADLNGDGYVTNADLILLARWLVGIDVWELE